MIKRLKVFLCALSPNLRTDTAYDFVCTPICYAQRDDEQIALIYHTGITIAARPVG
jgi:hypothetical protein